MNKIWAILPLITIQIIIMGASPKAWCARALPFFDAKDLTPYWTDEHTPHTPYRLQAFHLQDQSGHSKTEKDLENQITLVNFFFAECPSVCPVMMTTLQTFQKNFKKTAVGKSFQIFSFSTEPEHDSPAVLTAYAKTHHLELAKWSLITGEQAQIFRLGSGLTQTSSKTADSTAFTHSTNLYVFDGQLRLRGIYDTANAKQMALLAQDLK